MPPLLEAVALTKSYRDAGGTRKIFEGVDLILQTNSIASLTGPSGSGKSTLLNIFGLLDRPTGGRLSIRGLDTANWSRTRLNHFRSRELGFVFQRHLLLPEFSLLENVTLPLLRSEGDAKNLKAKGLEILRRFGLEHRSRARPSQLSGGEAQRGAICRAMVHRPALLLLDEPTGNLDPELGLSVMKDVFAFCREQNSACLLVTHNPQLAGLTDERHEMQKLTLARTSA